MTLTHRLAVASFALVALMPTLASAEVKARATATTTIPAQVLKRMNATSTTATSTPKMLKAKERAAQEIDRRIKTLTELSKRIEETQKVTDAFKQSITANVQAEIVAFTTLKAKIANETDEAALKSDIKAITESYRVYALVVPQARIAAAADRVVVMTSMMSTVGTKLEARIKSAKDAGAVTTTLEKVLADLGTQLGTASAKAQSAVSTSAALTPDEGDKAKMTANTTALKAAKADLAAAQKALKAARKDIDVIQAGLKKVTVSTTTATTTPAR